MIEKLKSEATAAKKSEAAAASTQKGKAPITKQRSRGRSGDSIDVSVAIKQVIKNTLPGIWDCRVPFQLLLRMLPELDFEVTCILYHQHMQITLTKTSVIIYTQQNLMHVRTLFCTLVTNNFGGFLENFLMKKENDWIVRLLVSR